MVAGKNLTEYQLRTRRVVIPVIAAVLLIGIPTVFTVFSSFTRWPVLGRSLLLALWIVVALIAAYLTNQTDERLHKAIRADQEAAIVAEHRATIRDKMIGMLHPVVCGIPDRYHLTVYAPTTDGAFLIPNISCGCQYRRSGHLSGWSRGSRPSLE